MISLLSSIARLKIFRYLLVGSIGASIDLLIYSIGTYGLGAPWLVASIFSSLISTLIGYYLSIYIVFESGVRYKRYQEIFGVLSISFIAFSMHQLLLYYFIEIWNLNLIISKIIAIGLIFFFNYFSRSFFIFSKPK